MKILKPVDFFDLMDDDQLILFEAVMENNRLTVTPQMECLVGTNNTMLWHVILHLPDLPVFVLDLRYLWNEDEQEFDYCLEMVHQFYDHYQAGLHLRIHSLLYEAQLEYE